EIQDDRAALLDLGLVGGEDFLAVARATVVLAAVNVHDGGAGLVGAPGLLGNLDGGVRNRLALLLGGARAAQGAGDGDLVLQRRERDVRARSIACQAEISAAKESTGSKSALAAPQSGQVQSSGSSAKGVPGAMPESGSPRAGS